MSGKKKAGALRLLAVQSAACALLLLIFAAVRWLGGETYLQLRQLYQQKMSETFLTQSAEGWFEKINA